LIIKINDINIDNWNSIEIIENVKRETIKKIVKPEINYIRLILSAGALTTGDFSGLESIIQLLQQFSYYVGLGYALWGTIEYTMDNPAGGSKVKRAVTGYIGIYVLPVIFKAIRNALS
jgi:hypothetical protein